MERYLLLGEPYTLTVTFFHTTTQRTQRVFKSLIKACCAFAKLQRSEARLWLVIFVIIGLRLISHTTARRPLQVSEVFFSSYKSHSCLIIRINQCSFLIASYLLNYIGWVNTGSCFEPLSGFQHSFRHNISLNRAIL